MCQISHQKLVLDTISSSVKEPVIIGMYTVEVRDGSQDRPFSYLKTCQVTMTPCLRPYKICKAFYRLAWLPNSSQHVLNRL
jgi:hypothetical protein